MDACRSTAARRSESSTSTTTRGSPSWSPDGKTIAFQGYRDGTWRIWTVAPDGTGAAAITAGPFDDREPHWSPDGTRIAFSSDRSGNYDIWMLDVNSRQATQVTKNPANDFTPTWSPDGREIAFVSTRTPSPGVYAIDAGRRRAAARRRRWHRRHAVVDAGRQRRRLQRRRAAARARLMLGTQELAASEDVFPFRAQWLSANELLYTADGKIKRRIADAPEASSSSHRVHAPRSR